MVEQGKAKPTDLYDIVTNRGFAEKGFPSVWYQ